jgi:hypothetical protein
MLVEMTISEMNFKPFLFFFLKKGMSIEREIFLLKRIAASIL